MYTYIQKVRAQDREIYRKQIPIKRKGVVLSFLYKLDFVRKTITIGSLNKYNHAMWFHDL